MRIRNLPKTEWDLSVYNLRYYGYGDVDIFIDESNKIGERVICIFRKKDLIKYEKENCFDKTFAILCNDCGIESGISFLQGLSAGQIIPVQFNGEFNPTIPLDWIKNKFWLF
jgi:hypothetical protein